MEEPQYCDKCGEYRVIMDGITAMMVCDSCGYVQEYSDFRSPWDFTTGEGGGNFVSANDTGALAGSRFSTLVNGRWANVRGVYTYHERKKALAMKKLDQITALLRLPAQKVDDVKFMVDKITQGEWGAGRWLDILIGACIYVTVRQSHLPLTIVEVAVVINCDVGELGRMYNRVIKYLDIKLPDVDLFIFLERAISSFPAFSDIDVEKKSRMMKHGRLLLQCAFQWFLTTGRRPVPIVAAILAFLAEVNEVNIGLEDLSKELNVPAHTSKLRHKELQESLVRVGQRLPWGKDITTKTVIRHAPFLLQYMEIKAKTKFKEKEKIVNGKASMLPMEVETAANKSYTSLKYLSVEKRLKLSEGQTQCKLVDITGGPVMSEQHPQSGLNTNGAATDLIEQQQHGLDLVDAGEHKISAKDLAKIHDQFLLQHASIRANVLRSEENIRKRRHEVTGKKKGHGQSILARYPHGSTLPHQRVSMQEIVDKQVESDALPPSFVASVEARARRRHKINAAKLRISKLNKPKTKHLGFKNIGVQKDAQQIKDDLRQSGILSSLSKKRKGKLEKGGIDWEDSIIECLLLHEADEKQIEDGHYNAMLDLHVFKSDENISDEELRQYFRSKREVALLSALYEDEPIYPWIRNQDL